MKNSKIAKLVACFSIFAMVLSVGAANASAKDDYYDPYKIYTEGIYVDDDLYIEPCFEHFRDKDDYYPALNIKGDLPSGTEFKLYIQTKPKQESVQTSDTIPVISGLGVYRVDVCMPGEKRVIFQSEIVLEGFRPCRHISETDDENGELALKGFKAYGFTNKNSRTTYNIRRGKSAGEVPDKDSYKVVMRQFENPALTFDYVRKLETIRAHTLILDIKGGALENPQKMVSVGTQIYDDTLSFATHEEMQKNRDTFAN